MFPILKSSHPPLTRAWHIHYTYTGGREDAQPLSVSQYSTVQYSTVGRFEIEIIALINILIDI